MGEVSRRVEQVRALTRSPHIVLAAMLGMLLVTGLMLWLALRSPEVTLRVSAGSELGRRHEIAEVLQQLARERGLRLELVPTAGSAASLERVAGRSLAVALVQGGLPAGSAIREVAPLALEPMHLLVREPAILRLEDLRGRSVDLSTPGSGTRELALELLELVHLRPERDFEEATLSYDQLMNKPAAELPDAIFHVSSLPSPVAEHLLRHRGYRLLPLPYARAMHMRDVAVREGVIPAYGYGASPPHPSADLPTIATRMLIVARDDVDDDAIRRLLEIVSSEALARRAELSPIGAAELAEPELPLHDGARAWLARNDPLITPEIIDNVESLRSFLVSAVIALILLWRWWRARQMKGFDLYLQGVTKLEREVLQLELEADLDLPRLLTIQRRLGELKNEALEGYAEGKISSADLLNSFLAHVTDVRAYLNALVLHERERLEKKARRDPEHEDAIRRELWLGAVRGHEEEEES